MQAINETPRMRQNNQTEKDKNEKKVQKIKICLFSSMVLVLFAPNVSCTFSHNMVVKTYQKAN